MDELVSKAVKEDEGKVFINPSKNSVLLFNYDDYPLVPGYYQVVVEVAGIFYYTKITVTPLHVSKVEWEFMRDDLESILNGLAMDVVFRNLSVGSLSGIKAPLPPHNLFVFLLINKKFSKLMFALTDLMTKANFNIRKNYKEKPLSTGAITDEMSFRYKIRRPENMTTIMSPVKSLNYNLQENKWIKHICSFFVKILEDFLHVVENYNEHLRKEIIDLDCYGGKANGQKNIKKRTIEDMKQLFLKAKQMQGALRMIENASWYSEISSLQSRTIPVALCMDSRYSVFYKLYQRIKRQDTNIILDKTYAYQWKCTYKLYEIWCFIQVCKTLSELGFSSCKGWLSDLGASLDNILVPAITPGTYIQYEKNNVVIRVAYDCKLPYMIEETNHDNNPVYICGAHNRPDIKLDIYIDGIYSGSLLMDVKYRNPSRFWEEEKLRNHQFSKVMSQLNCYSTQCFSPHLYRNNPNDSHPVPEVWVMYPSKGNNKSFDNRFFRSQRIRFIRINPTEPNLLKVLLNERLTDFEEKAIKHRQKEKMYN